MLGSLARIAAGLFDAVELVIGDLGTVARLRSDGNVRVLDEQGKPIPGL